MRGTILLALITWIAGCLRAADAHQLSAERVVFQTKFGDLEFATWPQARIYNECSPDMGLQRHHAEAPDRSL